VGGTEKLSHRKKARKPNHFAAYETNQVMEDFGVAKQSTLSKLLDEGKNYAARKSVYIQA
jgi:hypothetical protein